LKLPHLLRVAEGPESFAALFAAMSAAGLRAGWLDLRRTEPGSAAAAAISARAATEAAGRDADPPGIAVTLAGLETAAALGVRRAVAAGGGRSLALKPLRGEPVLRDLVREHFLGCTLVLVRGGGGTAKADAPALAEAAGAGRLALESLPALSPAGDGWQVSSPAAGVTPLRFDTAKLLACLRRPRPWGEVDLARR
jgi:hypothetical protein